MKDHCVGVPSLNRYLETGLLQTSFFAQSAGCDILLTQISRLWHLWGHFLPGQQFFLVQMYLFW